MSAKITHKSLFTLVDELIESKIVYPLTDDWKTQLSRSQVLSDVSFTSKGIILDTADVTNDLLRLISDIVPPRIKSGLNVSETDPISNSVIVKPGVGYIGGKIYELNLEVTVQLPIPSDTDTYVFYVTLYTDGVQIERTENPVKLTLAKVVIPKPGTTIRIRNKQNDDYVWDAHIVQFQEYKLYGDLDGNLEEDSKEFLRDNIGDILADNLIGNIRLNENLKILNTAGSIQIDSLALSVFDENDNLMSKLNKDGTYFYDVLGIEMARFTTSDARVGNILITKNSLETGNFSSGSAGFQIQDDGNAEFNDVTARGTIYANAGEIGGFTIASNKLYGTTTGTIQTGANVGTGQNGVKLDYDGLHVYDGVLGRVVFFPSNGDAPTISSGVIREVTYEITTNSVMRTATTVGDGSSASAGILINNTGMYGCEANQTLANANLKVLATGDIYLKGEINATRGQIGNVTITNDGLFGGLISGSTIRGAIIENSDSYPRIRMDETGLYYQVSPSSATYGASGSGLTGFQYGDGTLYGSGVLAYLFNENYPVLSIQAEQDVADIRLYNRNADPDAGTHAVGDLICVDGGLKLCTTAGTPGTFTSVSTIPNAIYDANEDTKIQVEESADEDIIRFDLGDATLSSAREVLTIQAIDENDVKIEPTTDNDVDLGSASKEFKDLYIDGVAYLDTGSIDNFNNDMLVALGIELRFGDTTVKISSETDAHLDLDADTSIDLIIGGTEQVEITNGAILPTTNNDIDLGSDAAEFKDIWIDGTAYLDEVTMHGNLNFNDNQAINFILENRTDDTGMTVTGQMWFRTDV